MAQQETRRGFFRWAATGLAKIGGVLAADEALEHLTGGDTFDWASRLPNKAISRIQGTHDLALKLLRETEKFPPDVVLQFSGDLRVIESWRGSKEALASRLLGPRRFEDPGSLGFIRSKGLEDMLIDPSKPASSVFIELQNLGKALEAVDTEFKAYSQAQREDRNPNARELPNLPDNPHNDLKKAIADFDAHPLHDLKINGVEVASQIESIRALVK